eukprot:gnl/TRDRNA2_/TRDRNA2_173254_c0_seq7.p1 gnl/TRDRNA2_/TRDRNA2_173254_c0~~gnl/TRDRNA2_/TRDRNA2_173254_c0_seq7.p1  ORF type:complete len:185 (+),score=26.65 gnl/TRDRNA2_/TRDRNA2_173254_c0_seq7:88-642(+)
MSPHLLVALLAARVITPTTGAQVKTYEGDDCSSNGDMIFTVPDSFCKEPSGKECFKNVEAESVSKGTKHTVGIAVSGGGGGGMFMTVAFDDGAETCSTKGEEVYYEVGTGVPGGSEESEFLDGKCVKVGQRIEDKGEEIQNIQLSGCASETPAPAADTTASQANNRRAYGLAMMIASLAATTMF